jgi:hypothetical protein
MKKTPTQTTITTLPSSEDLPIIRIVSEEEEMHVKLGLEMEDETHDMLVKWGKEVASDEDYVRIAIDAGIREAVDALNKEDTLPLV